MRQASGANSSGDDDFIGRLASEIAGLPARQKIMVDEFTPEGVTVWRIRLDPAGTPVSRLWPACWPDLTEGHAVSPAKLAGHIRTSGPGRLLMTIRGCTAETDTALSQARRLYPDARVCRVSAPVGDLLEGAVARVPLSQRYELASVRVEDGNEALISTPYPLFPPGACPSDSVRVRFRAETADEGRVAFAVLALDEDTDAAQYRTVQPLRSAPLPPDIYEMSATLVRRGKVRFEGLPKPLAQDERTMDQVLAAVPPQRSSTSPVHLIIAIELCEPPERYAQRVDCADRLVKHISAEAQAPVRYSVVGYGSHSFTRMARDPAAEEVCWEADAYGATSALGYLESRPAVAGGIPHQAKLECALDDIAQRLIPDGRTSARSSGRPVLVTIGTRSPFPASQPHREPVLPCPHRVSWKDAIGRMTARYGRMTFGALYDGDEPAPQVWKALGRHARGVQSGFHPRQFATELGLLVPGSRSVPLPIVLLQNGRDDR